MKMNNKGFSLVELIVVIAIMAILVGVLAPTVIGQVEKSRVSKDVQACDSLATAFATAVTEEMTKQSPHVSAGDTFTFSVTTRALNVAASGDNTDAFAATNVAPMVGGFPVSMASDSYNGATVTVEVLSDYRIKLEATNGGATLVTIMK